MGVDVGALAEKQEISLEALSGRAIAVDGNNTLYQFLAIIRQRDGSPLTDSRGRVTSHLSGLFYRTARLVEAGIKPAFVFDGEPPRLKKKTIEERREIRADAKERWEAALKEGDIATARTAAMASSRLTPAMVGEAKKLLFLMGIPVVQAPQEGEAQAAAMAIDGKVWASASQDYDSLLLGAPRLVRNLTVTGRRKLPGRNEFVEVVPELIELEKLLSSNGITREQLAWMGLLVGTDFNEGVKGIGPKKALKLVKTCSTLEEVVAKSGGAFEVEPSDVIELFLHPKVTHDYELSFGKPDAKAITDFLVGEYDFTPERVTGQARAFAEKMAALTQQSRLGDWFG